MGLIPFAKQSVPDQIFHMIKDEIMSGKYAVGDKIPSEHELSEILNTSRVSVRSALQKLATLGVIDTRVGNGNFVKKFDLKEYIDNVEELIIAADDAADMAEFRIDTEISCALAVMERASKEELAQLHLRAEELDQVFQEKNRDINSLQEMDICFHYQIYKLSQNRIYKLAYQAFCSRMYTMSSINLEKKTSKGRQSLSSQSHVELVEILMAKDTAACNAYYHQHFQLL